MGWVMAVTIMRSPPRPEGALQLPQIRQQCGPLFRQRYAIEMHTVCRRVFLARDPMFDAFHTDPRWNALVKKVGA
jgi:hypothetical protein